MLVGRVIANAVTKVVSNMGTLVHGAYWWFGDHRLVENDGLHGDWFPECWVA